MPQQCLQTLDGNLYTHATPSNTQANHYIIMLVITSTVAKSAKF